MSCFSQDVATALIDGNNFYAACEKSLDPSLSGRPLVVLSNNDGCIVARSTEARELGIPMGQPYFKARHELKKSGVEVRSSNYALYGDMSQRLMTLLRFNCEELEIYSIDEAFVRIKRPCNQNLLPWARRLRALVYQNLGLPISIGIGNSKGQAKLANYLSKSVEANAGIFDFSIVEDPDTWLEMIEIENVWGIGRKLARWCRIKGVQNARQFCDIPVNELRSKCGVLGVRLQHELRGQPCLPLITKPQEKKETCVSRSFSRPVTDLEELCQAIATYAVCAAQKLRFQKQYAASISVFIRTNPYKKSFYSQNAKIKLDPPTNETSAILSAALNLTKRIFKPDCLFIKAGVVLHSLQSTSYLQENLLGIDSKEERKRRDRLMQLIDHLNKRYGSGTINWAICGSKPGWGMNRKLLSRAYTTRINQIPIVRA